MISNIIIGIDPATSCGWAVRLANGGMVSGVVDLSAKRHESSGMRFLKMRATLLTLLKANPGAIVAYEEVARHRGTAAAHCYGGLVAMIQSTCLEVGSEYLAMPVGTVKKLATGKGNASKEEMVEAANRKWGTNIVSDDDADARWIAEAAAAQLEIMAPPLSEKTAFLA